MLRRFFTYAFFLCAAVSSANADGLAGRSPENKKVVLIAAIDEKDAFSSIVQAFRGQLSDLPVDLQVIWVDSLPLDFSTQEETARHAAQDNDASAVFWCELRRVDKMYLYVAVPELDRVLVRRIEGSGPGGTSETIAIIARGSIESMLKGASAMEQDGWESSGERAQTEEDVQPASPELKIEAKRKIDEENRFAVEAAYAIDSMSYEHPAVQGFHAGLDVHVVSQWHLFGGYVFFGALENTESNVKLTLRRHPMFLGMRYLEPINRFKIGGAIAVNIDYLSESIDEITAEENLSVSDNGAEVSVSLVPEVYLGARIVSTVWIFTCIGADIPIRKTDYFIDNGGDGQETVFRSWPVRPMGRIGVSVGFL